VVFGGRGGAPGAAVPGVGVTERLVTARELAELLGFAPATIVDWAERGEVPAFKLGGRLRFRESEVLAWLEGRRLRCAHPHEVVG
jgi:excisionase family DNA binding protein